MIIVFLITVFNFIVCCNKEYVVFYDDTFLCIYEMRLILNFYRIVRILKDLIKFNYISPVTTHYVNFYL